ncbi:hypothetical protein M8818_004005 [Zalaria obscura]|uniref:Uncharacterized protein n=1 Tax=Zalaria obscura TaxID=2024903 RepID=A0ACC3SDR9_9PEZI
MSKVSDVDNNRSAVKSYIRGPRNGATDNEDDHRSDDNYADLDADEAEERDSDAILDVDEAEERDSNASLDAAGIEEGDSDASIREIAISNLLDVNRTGFALYDHKITKPGPASTVIGFLISEFVLDEFHEYYGTKQNWFRLLDAHRLRQLKEWNQGIDELSKAGGWSTANVEWIKTS